MNTAPRTGRPAVVDIETKLSSVFRPRAARSVSLSSYFPVYTRIIRVHVFFHECKKQERSLAPPVMNN